MLYWKSCVHCIPILTMVRICNALLGILCSSMESDCIVVNAQLDLVIAKHMTLLLLAHDLGNCRFD